jgi:RNA polymerase sigma-70 factor (ECF subfamily)
MDIEGRSCGMTGTRTVPSPHPAADSAPPISDRVLVDAAASGDRVSFEALMHRYGPALHRFARRILRDEGDVAEVVQDTFVAAWRQLATFRGDAAVRTWLFTICSRKVIDSTRVKRAQPIDDRLLEPLAGAGKAVDPFAFASNSAFIAALEIALAELPPRQRASWVLREVDSLTFPEIGVVLALSPDAVRGHHRRAQAMLGQRLRRWR